MSKLDASANNNMEAFKYGIIIVNWGTVLAGLIRRYITGRQVLQFCESGHIRCNEKRYIELYLEMDESLFAFIKKIKEFIIEDRNEPIDYNHDSNYAGEWGFIPKVYLEFWEIELLLRTTSSNKDIETKLIEIDCIHSEFYYPEQWHPFIYYMSTSEGAKTIEAIYQRAINYTDHLIAEYKKINRV